jgi:hypothetical protein
MRLLSLAASMFSTLVVGSAAPAATMPPPCSSASDGWCVARRFPGEALGGELGFRFGEPLDVDGDGHADIAAGARFALHDGRQTGRVYVWSGKTGALIRSWDGPAGQDGLFGHWVLPLPDLGKDGFANVVIVAPNLVVDEHHHGLVTVRSPKTGAELWHRSGPPLSTIGWDLAPAGDQNGDGRTDLFVGQPTAGSGVVLLLSGKDGAVLRTYAPEEAISSFGWFVARLDDLDGDGHPDLAVGAQPGNGPEDPPGGRAYAFSAASGKLLFEWKGTDSLLGFGEVVARVGDLDGDGRGDVAVSAPGTPDQERTRPGEVTVYSGATGKPLRHWTGTQPGELYGRMVTAVGDIDGDRVEDLAISAPWHRTDVGDRVGRVELRSGRSGELLQELGGEHADQWFGWHIRRAPDPDRHNRPTVLIGSLRERVGTQDAVGVLDLCVLRRKKAHAH